MCGSLPLWQRWLWWEGPPSLMVKWWDWTGDSWMTLSYLFCSIPSLASIPTPTYCLLKLSMDFVTFNCFRTWWRNMWRTCDMFMSSSKEHKQQPAFLAWTCSKVCESGVCQLCSHIILRSKLDNDAAAIYEWTHCVSHLPADRFHGTSSHYWNTYMSQSRAAWLPVRLFVRVCLCIRLPLIDRKHNGPT